MSGRVSPSLAPPPKSHEDPGAHELDSSENEDDHFSDAPEARTSRSNSPIPTTRVEKVDDTPSHGEIPGTAAYNMRTEDAVPDEVDVVSRRSRESSRSPSISRGVIPLTVVEKVDPALPSHGEVPGTTAHEIRKADAVPDMVLRAPEPGSRSPSLSPTRSRANSTPGDLPIPKTIVTKIAGDPSHGEVPGTLARNKHQEDAEPDAVEQARGLPTTSVNRSIKTIEKSHSTSDDEDEDSDDEGEDEFGDDFDDFEEGAAGDDDFGDFDQGFQEQDRLGSRSPPKVSQAASVVPFPILDYDELDSPAEVIAATSEHLKGLYPDGTPEEPSRLDELPRDNSIFLTDRSASLWAQLVAPPPLQPPNWLRSRIRRLFLVSLGVPIDLDEILPASKQKKLVLPSVHISSSSPRASSDALPNGSVSRLKQQNGSSSSVGGQSKSRPRKGPPPAPQMDLAATRSLCATNDAALAEFTDEELQAHIEKLKSLTQRTGEVLEYWLKRKDGAMGDKEAFEGVIENLVKHARKVRK